MVAPDIRNLLAQDREEATEDGCGGYRGMDGEVLLGVWDNTDVSTFFKVLGTNVVVLRQQLDSGGT